MGTAVSSYPKREAYFAHRFVRLLHKSCSIQEVGLDGFALLVIIAHTEDAIRYKGPVGFWNQTLLETLGLSKWDQLAKARQKCIDKGWLQYHGDGKRTPGQYFVTIPDQYLQIDDGPIDHQYTLVNPEMRYKQGYDAGYKAGYNDGYKAGDVQGDVQGEPFNPVSLIPQSPIPAPVIDEFWGENEIPASLTADEVKHVERWAKSMAADPTFYPGSPSLGEKLAQAARFKRQGHSIEEMVSRAIAGQYRQLYPGNDGRATGTPSYTHPDFLDIQKIAREHGSANEADQDWRRQNMTIEQKKARKAIGGDWSQFVTASGFDLKTLADRYLAELERARTNG